MSFGTAMAGVGNFLGQLAGPVIGLYNSIQDRNVSRENTDKTIAANKAMAEYAYSQDKEMWNLQNEYNTPSNQMQRFKDAGLNPNMIYGQGSPGNATVMPKYNAPRQEYNYQPLRLPQAMSMFQDFAMKQAQIDNVKEQTDLTKLKQATEAVLPSLRKAQRLKTGREGELAMWRSDSALSKSQMDYELAQYSKEFAKAKLDQLMQDIRNKNLAGDIREMDVEWYKWMKSSGIVGQSVAPLLRMFFK